jgi:hypothetical protein
MTITFVLCVSGLHQVFKLPMGEEDERRSSVGTNRSITDDL